MKFYRLSDAAFYDRIDTLYQFNKSFLDKKCLFLRDMEPLNSRQVFADKLITLQYYPKYSDILILEHACTKF